MYQIIATATEHNYQYYEGQEVRLEMYHTEEEVRKEVQKLRRWQSEMFEGGDIRWTYDYEGVSVG